MTATLDLSQVSPGFADPVLDAQSAFRQVLLALSEPGTLVRIDHSAAPDGLHTASAAFALTLLDFDTPVWLSPSLRTVAIENWLRFHCGCPVVEDPSSAAFAIVDSGDGAPDLTAFSVGDPKYPDRSATVVHQLPAIDGGAAVTLSGPGIPDTREISPMGLPDGFWAWRADNWQHFQLGVDTVLVSGGQLLGLPRTTQCVLSADIPKTASNTAE